MSAEDYKSDACKEPIFTLSNLEIQSDVANKLGPIDLLSTEVLDAQINLPHQVEHITFLSSVSDLSTKLSLV